MRIIGLAVLLLHLLVSPTSLQLLINVKNQTLLFCGDTQFSIYSMVIPSDGEERFSIGDHEPEHTASPLGGQTTWSQPRGAEECRSQAAAQSGALWGRSMFSSGCLQADDDDDTISRKVRFYWKGGDVTQENITANVSEDTVTLEFMRLDGVYISQLVDFSNEVEAVKVVIPAEEELGQSGHQTFCFLTHAAQADFIAPDAMAKLRQKNPGTVRTAEEDKGWRQTTATAWAGRATRLLSPAAAAHCASARERTYLRAADLARWAPRPGIDQSSYTSAVTPFPAHALTSDLPDGKPAVVACVSEFNPVNECLCHLEVCVNWYPCGLKYCKGKPQGGLSYRCGIKTCRRCYRYHFYVRRRDACATYT